MKDMHRAGNSPGARRPGDAMSPRMRPVLALLCLFWVTVAVAQVIRWATGADMAPGVLALNVVGGVFGLIGLIAYGLARRADSRRVGS